MSLSSIFLIIKIIQTVFNRFDSLFFLHKIGTLVNIYGRIVTDKYSTQQNAQNDEYDPDAELEIQRSV